MEALLSSPNNQVQGFLAAGHVCTIMGFEAYEPISRRYHIPIVVTGFEPVDILEGVLMVVKQLEAESWTVENQYTRSVTRSGNMEARRMIEKVFDLSPRTWRGIGVIPNSGLQLRSDYSEFDAGIRLQEKLPMRKSADSIQNECHSGEILQGLLKPSECPAFGNTCTPSHPLGAPMVSSEGACAAYYRYRSAGVPIR